MIVESRCCHITSSKPRQLLPPFNAVAEPAHETTVLIILIPRKPSSAIRILTSGHTHLIAVVDARCPRQQTNEQPRHLKSCFVIAAACQKPWHVVAVEQIQLRPSDLRWITPQEVIDSGGKFFG